MIRLLGTVALALVAGCAGIERSAAPASAPVDKLAATPAATLPTTAATTLAATPAATPAAGPEIVAAPVPAVDAPAAASSTTVPSTNAAPKVDTPAKPPAKVVPLVGRVPATPAPRPSAATNDAVKPAPPPLDLKSLEARLRETKAIGVMTKLALKNQVDDLLDQFREFYKGKRKTTLAELRSSYERLLLKVLALLQDADPPLANAIAASRDAIWGILADPVKFATV